MIEITRPDGTKITVSTAAEYAIVMSAPSVDITDGTSLELMDQTITISEAPKQLELVPQPKNVAKTVILPVNEYRVFEIIRDWSPEPLHSGEIAALITDVNKGNLSNLCSNLKRKGLIRRVESGHWGYELVPDCLVKFNVISRTFNKRLAQ